MLKGGRSSFDIHLIEDNGFLIVDEQWFVMMSDAVLATLNVSFYLSHVTRHMSHVTRHT
jgi:hypothetical protein